ncbi:MAG: hypothetical protein U0667_02840 [Chloroflexota bacterium]
MVTGTVTRIVEYWRHQLPGTFVLRVDDVLKGQADARLRLSDVYTTGGCVVSWLEVQPGDRIAVALGGDSDVNGSVSSVAFLTRLPALARVDMAGMRRLTMAQVREAVGLPATDMVASDPDPVGESRWAMLAGLARAAVEVVTEVIGRLRPSS